MVVADHGDDHDRAGPPHADTDAGAHRDADAETNAVRDPAADTDTNPEADATIDTPAHDNADADAETESDGDAHCAGSYAGIDPPTDANPGAAAQLGGAGSNADARTFRISGAVPLPGADRRWGWRNGRGTRQQLR